MQPPESSEPPRSIVALSWQKTSTRPRRSHRNGQRRGVKTYLSTQRCPRIEVVGNPQHPQHGKTQQYPRFPPHGCLALFRPGASCSCSALFVATRPGWLCPRRELRRAALAAFVSRSGGAEGGSRKQPADISGVRGQRLADSNPIKHWLRQPWRRAGTRGRSTLVG